VPSSAAQTALYCPAGGGRGRGRAAHGGVLIRSRVRPTGGGANVDGDDNTSKLITFLRRKKRRPAHPRGRTPAP
jgi:hypothetical protein